MALKPSAVLGELANPPNSLSRDWTVHQDSLLLTEYSNEPFTNKSDFDQRELVQYWLYEATPADIIFDAVRKLRVMRDGTPERFVDPDNAQAIGTIIRGKVDTIPDEAYEGFRLPDKPRTILESTLSAYDTAASDFHDINYDGLRSDAVRRASIAANIIIEPYIKKPKPTQAPLAEQSVAS